MNRREVLFGGAALATTKLTDAQLDGVTAAAKPVNGNAGPYTQQPVKGQNVVKGVKGASCQCGQGAVVKGKK